MVCAVLIGCGGAAPASVDPSPVERAELVPPSDRDPLPYAPEPEAEGRTDRTASLAAAGGEDQARHMLPAFLSAVCEGDERRLEALLADDLAQVQSHGRGHEAVSRPRSILVQRVMIQAQRAGLPPDVTVAELVDLVHVNVTRAAQRWEGDLPNGLRPTDVVVEVPLEEAGRAALSPLLGWRIRGLIVVRPGRDPRIVGL